MKEIDFWFEFASTYSYLAVERIEGLAKSADIKVNWRPLLLGPIFHAQGWDTSPFLIYPAKGAYMWRDMARLAEDYGIAFRKPSTFPRPSLMASRVAFLASDEPWCAEFVKRVFRANFADDRATETNEVIVEVLGEMGQDASAIQEAIAKPKLKDDFKAQNAEASSLGIFGAPAITCGRELFWGHDRLEQALAWAGRS